MSKVGGKVKHAARCSVFRVDWGEVDRMRLVVVLGC